MPGGEDFGRERSVCKPSDIGSAAGTIKATAAQEAEVEQQAAKCRNPEAEGIEAREGHIARAQQQRPKVITEAGEHGQRIEEDHRHAVHGEELAVLLGSEQSLVGAGELRADEQSFDAADQQKEKRGENVALADFLVVDGGEPAEEAGFALPDFLKLVRAGRTFGSDGDDRSASAFDGSDKVTSLIQRVQVRCDSC